MGSAFHQLCPRYSGTLTPTAPTAIRLWETFTFFSAEKTKLMTNSANGIQREIKVKGQKMGNVTSFKYLGAVVSDDGSKPKVLSRIAQATAALTKLKPIWRDNNISLGSKVKLMCSFVISIFLYNCESWTLTAELKKRTQAFEMRYYRRLLNISYKDMLPMRRFAERSKQPLENMTNS